MIHKDICIKFKVEDRYYEAVGFLNEGEQLIDGNTMLSRTTRENGGAIGEEDWTFLSERRSNFPKELREYYLATGRRSLDCPRDVSYFYWRVDRWYQHWHSLVSRWYDIVLVLRRCA